MTDSWCKPIRSKNGTVVSGGAARNVRIAAACGMDTIVEEVAAEAAKAALERSNMAVRKTNIRLVKAA
jgi:hypothetical protein